jgi:hypothetical protein
MNRKSQNSQKPKPINYTGSISRRRLLEGCFALTIALATPRFKKLSKIANDLLISLGEFDLAEGARIGDLVYVSELSPTQFQKATDELTKLSLIYCQGQSKYQRFFLSQFH